MSSRFTILILFAAVLISCQSTAQHSNTSTVAESQVKPKAITPDSPIAHLDAPRQEGTYPFDILLKKADGSEHSSADILKYRKGPTIISFWLTTCGPCLTEFAAMEKKYAQWQSEMDFNFVAISTDFPKRHDAFVQMVNKKDWPWESYLDVNRQFWNVMPGALNGLPQVFVYNEAGEVVYYKRKYSPGDEDTLFSKIKELQ